MKFLGPSYLRLISDSNAVINIIRLPFYNIFLSEILSSSVPFFSVCVMHLHGFVSWHVPIFACTQMSTRVCSIRYHICYITKVFCMGMCSAVFLMCSMHVYIHRCDITRLYVKSFCPKWDMHHLKQFQKNSTGNCGDTAQFWGSKHFVLLKYWLMNSRRQKLPKWTCRHYGMDLLIYYF